ncbi:MAG: hypothetical protein R6U96_14030 [Promethearchaeia archaeon]
MNKFKVLFSFEKRKGIVEEIFPLLQSRLKDVEIVYHNPKDDVLALNKIGEKYGDFNLFVVKVASESSIDLLHFAELYNIPCLHDIKSVLICKNKVALDHHIRKIISNLTFENNFRIPLSWTRSLLEKQSFKTWVKQRFPVILKSHYQSNVNIRFNYLVRNMQEVDDFYKTYKEFIYYDVYIQEFIECDGMDRKIYVMGDEVFGVKRRNPIYIFMEENVESLNVEEIEREQFIPSPQIQKLARTFAEKLDIKIFGFDLITPQDKEEYYLIDLNDFPGFSGIEKNSQYLLDFFTNFIRIQMDTDN